MNYIGIDPGYHGAVAVIDAQGLMQVVWDIPLVDRRAKGRAKRVDVHALDAIFSALTAYPESRVRLEWPTTRPDEAAEASKNFGVGLGHLEALCIAHRLSLEKVAPNKWKQDLGLPGKKRDPEAGRKACEEALRLIPNLDRSVLFGPRGGPRDGRAEALLIAWHGWSRKPEGMRVLVERWGRDSDAVRAFVLTAGSGRRGRRPIRGGSVPF